MGNRIKKDTIFIVAETLTDSSAFKAGETIGNYKECDNRWIVTDSKGKKWQNLITHLRNENFFKIINQYSMSDIIYYMQSKNENYYTVIWEMLVDAVKTTFRETRITCIDDIYKYVSENLI